MPALPLGLQPYANQVISVAGRTIAVQDLIYTSQEDLYSTCAFTSAASTGVVAANQSQRLFQLAPGETGQGFTTALGESETNNVNGARFQGNEIYLSIGIGFEWYITSGVGSLEPVISTLADKSAAAADLALSSSDIQKLGLTFQWTFQVGSGPERIKGQVIQYPFGAGVYSAGVAGTFTAPELIEAAAQNGGPNVPMRKFDSPLVFPPNIEVVIRAKNSTQVTLAAQDCAVALRAYMRGFRMTLPA